MLSKKAKYGLKALIVLGRYGAEKPMLISEIADRERIPIKFLELILLELKKHGIVHSKKGKGGGYLLGKEPGSITLSQIIRTLDGPLALTPCVSEIAYRKCDECLDVTTCPIRLTMKQVREAVVKILDSTTLEDVIKRARKLGKKDK